MTFFPEDRAAELRELFFETAQDLLQTLNDAGLELEKRPADAGLLRHVRRTVHTLKGDAAACGYQELSKLAHELEDVLMPELAAAGNSTLAEVILTAADTFQAILAAYRDHLQPPSGEALRTHIRRLMQVPSPKERPALQQPRFAWSEYDRMMIAEAARRGEPVYNIALYLQPDCTLRAAALQLIRNVLQAAGRVLALTPDGNSIPEDVDLVEVALASDHPEEWVANQCRIPAVVARIVVKRATPGGTTHQALPGDPRNAEGAYVSAPERASGSGGPAGEPTGTTPTGRDAAEEAQSDAPQKPETTLRVDAARIDNVLNLVGELIIGKSMLHQVLQAFAVRYSRDPLCGKFADALAFQSRVLDDLQQSVLKIRMVPVEQLFRRFPRVARDVAKLSGKDVALAIAGQDTELDKSILDALAEPLAHLVRNAVDHGIEPPEERRAASKPPRGTVRLSAYHQGNQVLIEVRDDGRGIAHEKIIARAIERGIISAQEAAGLSRAEARELIFHPGFSTADQVTEISGRGVGLDVVRSILQRLKGAVSVESKPGQGTGFLLSVPLTLTSIQALLFEVSDRLYGVPLAAVGEIARATESQIHRVDDYEVLQLRDHLLTLVRLSQLEPNRPGGKGKTLFIIVIRMGERQFGLVVDKLRGEEELVIKPLDHNLVATDVVSGASILGDGTVVLILDIPAVVTKLAKTAAVGVTS